MMNPTSNKLSYAHSFSQPITYQDKSPSSALLTATHNVRVVPVSKPIVNSIPKYTPPATLSETPMTNELKTKDQLIEKIKEWVKIDNDIRVLQKEQKKRQVDKKKVSVELIQVMRENEIDAFDLNDGQILYDKRNIKKPITKTALMGILTTYYKGDAVKANEVNQYILDNREEVVHEKIVRKISKTKPTSGITQETKY